MEATKPPLGNRTSRHVFPKLSGISNGKHETVHGATSPTKKQQQKNPRFLTSGILSGRESMILEKGFQVGNGETAF